LRRREAEGQVVACVDVRIVQSRLDATRTRTMSVGCPAPGPIRETPRIAGVPRNRAWITRTSCPGRPWDPVAGVKARSRHATASANGIRRALVTPDAPGASVPGWLG